MAGQCIPGMYRTLERDSWKGTMPVWGKVNQFGQQELTITGSGAERILREKKIKQIAYNHVTSNIRWVATEVEQKLWQFDQYRSNLSEGTSTHNVIYSKQFNYASLNNAAMSGSTM